MKRALWLAFGMISLAACKKEPSDSGDSDEPSSEVEPVVTAEFFEDLAPMNLSEDIAFAFSASTPWMMFITLSPQGMLGAAPEGDCPVVTSTNTGAVTQGDCTAEDGTVWYGTATTSGFKTTYEGFGVSTATECADGGTNTAIYDGVVTMIPTQSGGIQFEADLLVHSYGVEDDCTLFDRELGVAYTGNSEYSGEDEDTDGQPDNQTFNGSGLFGMSDAGQVHGTTDNELINSIVCDFEAASGSTTLTAGGQTAVITYDGATDCSEEATVTWTLDGVDQGELSGVSCSTSGGLALGWALPALALLRRRTARKGSK